MTDLEKATFSASIAKGQFSLRHAPQPRVCGPECEWCRDLEEMLGVIRKEERSRVLTAIEEYRRAYEATHPPEPERRGRRDPEAVAHLEGVEQAEDRVRDLQ